MVHRRPFQRPLPQAAVPGTGPECPFIEPFARQRLRTRETRGADFASHAPTCVPAREGDISASVSGNLRLWIDFFIGSRTLGVEREVTMFHPLLRISVAAGIAVCATAPLPVSAQITTGTIAGSVKDAQGDGRPRRSQVQVSTNGTTWSSPVTEGWGSGLATAIAFRPVRATFVRITQTAAVENAPAWSIQRLRLYQAPGRGAATAMR